MAGGVGILVLAVVGFVLAVVLVPFVFRQPLIYGAFLGMVAGGIYGVVGGIDPILAIPAGAAIGAITYTSVRALDVRFVDRGVIGGAAISAVAISLISVPTEGLVFAATLGGVAGTGLTFERGYEAPQESRRALRAIGSTEGAGAEATAGSEASEPVPDRKSLVPPGYDRPDAELRDAIDPTAEGMLRFALSYPLRAGGRSVLFLSVAIVPGAIFVAPVVLLVSYAARVAAAAANGYEEPPPFASLRGLFSEGIGLTVVICIYTILTILFAVFFWLFAMGEPNPLPPALQTPWLGLIPVLCYLCGMPAVFLSYVRGGSVLAGFNVFRILKIGASLTYLKHLLGQWVIWVVGAIVASVAAFSIIGWVFVLGYGVLASAALWGRAWYAMGSGS